MHGATIKIKVSYFVEWIYNCFSVYVSFSS